MAKKNDKKNGAKGQPAQITLSDEERYDQVACKAYELYQQRGEVHGHDLEDWFKAERLVHEALPEDPMLKVRVERRMRRAREGS